MPTLPPAILDLPDGFLLDFFDLKDNGVVDNRMQLQRAQERYNFPLPLENLGRRKTGKPA